MWGRLIMSNLIKDRYLLCAIVGFTIITLLCKSLAPDMVDVIQVLGLLLLGFIIDKFRMTLKAQIEAYTTLDELHNATNVLIDQYAGVIATVVESSSKSKVAVQAHFSHIDMDTSIGQLCNMLITMHIDDLDFTIDTLEDVLKVMRKDDTNDPPIT